MCRYKFKEDINSLSDRSNFANRVLKLIYQKNNYDIDKSIIEAEPFFDDFEEHVRNIYELISSEIPLYAYYELKKYGADNFGLTDDEYIEAINNTITASNRYYKDNY